MDGTPEFIGKMIMSHCGDEVSATEYLFRMIMGQTDNPWKLAECAYRHYGIFIPLPERECPVEKRVAQLARIVEEDRQWAEESSGALKDRVLTHVRRMESDLRAICA